MASDAGSQDEHGGGAGAAGAGTGEGEAAAALKRQRGLEAQRAFRKRKAAHLQELERKVALYEVENAQLKGENGRLREENEWLRRQLLPPGSTGSESAAFTASGPRSSTTAPALGGHARLSDSEDDEDDEPQRPATSSTSGKRQRKSTSRPSTSNSPNLPKKRKSSATLPPVETHPSSIASPPRIPHPEHTVHPSYPSVHQPYWAAPRHDPNTSSQHVQSPGFASILQAAEHAGMTSKYPLQPEATLPRPFAASSREPVKSKSLNETSTLPPPGYHPPRHALSGPAEYSERAALTSTHGQDARQVPSNIQLSLYKIASSGPSSAPPGRRHPEDLAEMPPRPHTATLPASLTPLLAHSAQLPAIPTPSRQLPPPVPYEGSTSTPLRTSGPSPIASELPSPSGIEKSIFKKSGNCCNGLIECPDIPEANDAKHAHGTRATGDFGVLFDSEADAHRESPLAISPELK